MTDRSIRAIETGENGEQAVTELLRERGYRVDLNWLEDWDLLIDGFLTVEVKTAHRSGRTDSRCKRWQFCLYAHKDRQKPIDEDVLILRCECEPPCHFIIPVFLVPEGLTKIDITTLDPWQYRGRWAAFRERWEFVFMVWAYIVMQGRTWLRS